MNSSTLAFLADEKVKAVACVFTDVNIDLITHKASVGKRYTYKCIEDVKIGDLVLVENNNSEFGFAVVKVVDIDADYNFNNTITYKWVASKINTDAYEELLNKEKELKKSFKRMERKNKAKQFLDAMNVESDDAKLALENFSNSK